MDRRVEPIAIDGLLAHQVRAGRVRKVATATFEVVPGSMSRSTRRRCLRWRDQLDELAADVPEWTEAIWRLPDPADPEPPCSHRVT